MKVLVTGAHGFIGKNLVLRLQELGAFEVLPWGRVDTLDTLAQAVSQADAVVHLAGVNRPEDTKAFAEVNVGLTERLCALMAASGRRQTLLLASSSHALADTPYGRSKLAAEMAAAALAQDHGHAVVIYRLPGVFGKWSRPNYNSVVATFCHNITHGLPIRIDDERALLTLVYIDDVVSAFIGTLRDSTDAARQMQVRPQYEITLGELAAQIEAFRDGRRTLMSERVGTGLVRALYSTYVSYLEPEDFSYELPMHGDTRGVFVEMLKTPDCGQFSFFSTHPGITRGGHYHHSKSEKFLVVKGLARFGFRHVVTGERFTLDVSGDRPWVVDTIPGWIHDITNIGQEEMLVMLWANEVFDRDRPDTTASKI